MKEKTTKNIIDLNKAKLKDLSLEEEDLIEEWKRKYGLMDKEFVEEDSVEKWRKWGLGDFDYEYLISKKCIHFGEVNVFGLVPISCYDITVEKINKLIVEKNIKAWLIMDLSCLIGVDIDKLTDVKIYFERIGDLSVPSFKEMNNIIEFISENMGKGNVMVSCLAGYGRTGLVLSVWAGLNGIDKPVSWVRENYCKEAVETVTQEMFVNLYLKYIKSLSR